MPIRQYKCQQCGETKERVFQSRQKYESAVYSEKCEKCGGESQPQVSLTAQPQFKGSGFYSTDYRNK